MTRISRKEARKLGISLPQLKKSKYGSRKVEVDGITFDSKKEANKYCELKMLKAAGKIAGFNLQPEFELQPGYHDKNGKWIKPIKYRADFEVFYPDGRVVVIDTKGFKTKEYLLKKKMLLYRYLNLEFVEE
ncbi:DUF1064 domain-containing protein [Peptococcaceae bacterium 1198_IL3148]